MGTLTVSNDSGNAAIGGGLEENSGLITIHGGEIEAKTLHLGAAIGGGGGSGGNGGDGTVEARATLGISFDAAIGGGKRGSGSVEISGDTITAETSGYGAGIGGGESGSGTVEISGGTVTARASGRGAAIGNGDGNSGGSVEIGGRHARPRGGERKRSCSGPEG